MTRHLAITLRRHAVWAVSVCFAAAGCTKAPLTTRESRGMAFQKDDIAAHVDEDGVTTGEISGSSAVTQMLTAMPQSNVGAVSVAFPPGALAVQGLSAVKVSIQEGSQLASSVAAQEMGLSTGFTGTGTPVVVMPSVPVNAAVPFTVAIPLPAKTGLALADDKSLIVVVYKTYDAETQKYYSGIIPPADLTVDQANGQVKLKTKLFGSFQAAYMEQPMTAAKKVETAAPIQTKVQEKTLPPLALVDTSDRKVRPGDDFYMAFSSLRPTFALWVNDKVVPDIRMLDGGKIAVRVPLNAQPGPVTLRARQDSADIPIDIEVLKADGTGNIGQGSNFPPQLNMYWPDQDVTPNWGGRKVHIGWNLNDPDNVSTLTLYMRKDAPGVCGGDMSSWTKLSAFPNTVFDYNWDFSNLSPGYYYLCAQATHPKFPAVFQRWPRRLVVDKLPDFAFTAPHSFMVVPAGTDHDITVQWTGSNIVGTAKVDLHVAAAGQECNYGFHDMRDLFMSDVPLTDGTGLGNAAVMTVRIYNTGLYKVCAVVSDEYGSRQVASDSVIQVVDDIATPALFVTSPVEDGVEIQPGSNLTITWQPSAAGLTFMALYLVPADGACTAAANLITNSVTDASHTYTWTVPIDLSSGYYRICSAQNGTLFTPTASRILVQRTCVWTGTTDSSWMTASNWTNCKSGIPTAFDKVVIPSTATSMPTIATSTSIYGIGEGSGGGKITLSVAALTFSQSRPSVRSDVTIEGVPGCAGCNVQVTPAAPDRKIVISHNAKLTIGANVRLAVGELAVGTPLSPGHFAAVGPVSPITYRPLIAGGIVTVEGPSGSSSTLALNYVTKEAHSDWGSQISLRSNSKILQFDNVLLAPEQSGGTIRNFFYGIRLVSFDSCTGVAVDDTAWDGITLNVTATRPFDDRGCALPKITVTGTGIGFPMRSQDPSSPFTWTPPAGNTCVWAGGSDSSWGNPLNWTGCNGATPAYKDFVVISGTATNMPMVSVDTIIRGFGVGEGGGVVRLAAATYLRVLESDDGQRSNVIIESASGMTCSDCGLMVGGGFTISGGKTLTLRNGGNLSFAGGETYVNVGRWDSPGHLVTEWGGDPSKVPSFAQAPRIDRWGSFWTGSHVGPIHVGSNDALAPSTVTVNGLRADVPYVEFAFDRNSRVLRMDNANLGTTRSSPTRDYGSFFSFRYCTAQTFPTTTWNNMVLNVPTGSRFNNFAWDDTCQMTPNMLSIIGSGNALDPAFRMGDPNGYVSVTPSM